VLYQTDSGDAIDTYGVEAPTWKDCVDTILSWLQIEVFPYWPAGSLRLSPCSGTDAYAAAALYGMGRACGIVSSADHDWLPGMKQMFVPPGVKQP